MSDAVGSMESCVPDLSRRVSAPRDVPQGLLAACALVFSASAALTISSSARMQDMGGMLMPGGWTLSPMWMRMPGHGWSDATAAFMGMWAIMMIAMMLPSLTPELLRHNRRVRAFDERRGDVLTAQVGAAYFMAVTVAGVVVFPLGVSVAEVMMRVPAIARAAPILAGVIVVVAGALQFTDWKTRHLACWADGAWCAQVETADFGAAWLQGVRLAVRCTRCCWPFMAILLSVGTMDMRAMTLVTVAITLERLVPDTARIVRAIGGVTVCAGLLLIARAAALV